MLLDQCEQTALCGECTESTDGCVQISDTAQLRDKLTGALIGLARSTENNEHLLSDSIADVVIKGLSATQINANADTEMLLHLMDRVDEEKRKMVPAATPAPPPAAEPTHTI